MLENDTDIVRVFLNSLQRPNRSLETAEITNKSTPNFDKGPWNRVMQDCWAEDPAERPGFEEIFLQLTNIYEDLTGRPIHEPLVVTDSEEPPFDARVVRSKNQTRPANPLGSFAWNNRQRIRERRDTVRVLFFFTFF